MAQVFNKGCSEAYNTLIRNPVIAQLHGVNADELKKSDLSKIIKSDDYESAARQFLANQLSDANQNEFLGNISSIIAHIIDDVILSVERPVYDAADFANEDNDY